MKPPGDVLIVLTFHLQIGSETAITHHHSPSTIFSSRRFEFLIHNYFLFSLLRDGLAVAFEQIIRHTRLHLRQHALFHYINDIYVFLVQSVRFSRLDFSYLGVMRLYAASSSCPFQRGVWRANASLCCSRKDLTWIEHPQHFL